ncbi:MAG: hypothetical protein ACUVXJ_05770 [Phycisphaerae bacterium]
MRADQEGQNHPPAVLGQPCLPRRSRCSQIKTAHIERLNGTLRGQQARLARRAHHGSRLDEALPWSLGLRRDLYGRVRPHGSLDGCTPAMILGLMSTPWSMEQYVEHPVHVSDLQREIRAEECQKRLTSALDAGKRKRLLTTS